MRHFPPIDQYPLEYEVVRLVERYLRSGGWNFQRIACRVEFGVKVRMASDHAINLDQLDGSGKSVGQVKLWFNFVYLHQHPGPFLSDIVAHECAHVLTNAEAHHSGRPIQTHGEEWTRWLGKLSRHARPEASGPGAIFDDRSIRLHKGGVPTQCLCDGVDGFEVVLKNGRARSGDDACHVCRNPYKTVANENIPAVIQDEVRFIQSCMAAKPILGWLGEDHGAG